MDAWPRHGADGRAGRTAARLAFGELLLDDVGRRAWTNERAVELTPREFALLAALMRHAGRTVSRRELLAEVWSLDFDPRSNLVDVYIRYLRRKLGPGWIVTERGAGYRIAIPDRPSAGWPPAS